MLGEERSRKLELPFSKKEVFEVLYSLSSDKTLVLDKFTLAFWQFCTKYDIMAFFLGVL